MNDRRREMLERQIETLRELEVSAQGSDAWLAARKKIITASEVASFLKCTTEHVLEYAEAFDPNFKFSRRCASSFASEMALIRKKKGLVLESESTKQASSPYLQFGHRFEPVAKQLYEHLRQTSVMEFGLIISKKNPWLGASPDGLALNGNLVEIKCPLTRKITGIPKLDYWVQCQIQMEVMDIESCDFFECEFIEPYGDRVDIFLNDVLEDQEQKGCVVWLDVDHVITPPLQLVEFPEEQYNWCQEKLKEIPNGRIQFWKLLKHSLVNIPRSQTWFEKVKPVIYQGYLKLCGYDPSKDLQLHEKLRKKIEKAEKQLKEPRVVLENIEISEDVCGEVFVNEPLDCCGDVVMNDVLDVCGNVSPDLMDLCGEVVMRSSDSIITFQESMEIIDICGEIAVLQTEVFVRKIIYKVYDAIPMDLDICDRTE